MKHTLYILLILSSVCFVIASLFNGCFILRPVGQAISQGYENSVSYFNGYYNAKWLFDEAEDEVKENDLKNRSQDTLAAVNIQIPAGTKDKFAKVIDKCSNILAFHSTSTLVDDALMLIGKSFYYQADYLKAERKFSELLTQYPNSPLVLETQIWYAQTEEKLKKTDAGIRICESVIAAAKASGDVESEIQARRILGKIYLQQKQIDKAVVEFEKEIALSDDDDMKAEAQMNLGSIYFSEELYGKAAEAFLKVRNYTSDPFSNYYSARQASVAYRKTNEYVKALPLVDELIENFRYQTYLPDLLFERANIYAASGKRNEAIDEYINIDTTYANSEYARRSAYQLGVIYEKEIGDYRLALKYYKEVMSAASPGFAADGRLKYNALARYFDAWKELENADSLLFALTDTTKETIKDTLNAELSKTDSLLTEKPEEDTNIAQVINTTGRRTGRIPSRSAFPAADSLSSVSDSTKHKVETVAPHPMKPLFETLKSFRSLLDSAQSAVTRASTQNSGVGPDSLAVLKFIADSIQKNIFLFSSKIADSLNVIKSISAQDLGDIFHMELSLPDSALFWYEKSIALSYNSLRSPRILYILAELSRKNTDEKSGTPEEYYLRLDRDFPETIYAREARRLLGKESTVIKADTAAIYYDQAEKQIDKKQYDNAIKTFRSIAQLYRGSPLAAKSEYAIGWILENNHEKPENVKAQYDLVVKNYKGSKYAIEAAKRLNAIMTNDDLKRDTAKVNETKPDKPGTKNAPADSTKINPVKIDTTKINREKIDRSKFVKSDTSRSDSAGIDTSGMETTKKDSSGINSVPADKKVPNVPDTVKDTVVSGKK